MSISVEMPGKLGMVKMECKVAKTTKDGVGIKLFIDEGGRMIFAQMQGISVY